MAIIIPFPNKQYDLLQRREDILQYFYYTFASMFDELHMNSDQLEEESAEVLISIENLVNSHLGLENYEDYSEGFRESDEEVQENFQ